MICDCDKAKNVQRLFVLLQNALGSLQEELNFNHDIDLINWFKKELGVTDEELKELGWE